MRSIYLVGHKNHKNLGGCKPLPRRRGQWSQLENIPATWSSTWSALPSPPSWCQVAALSWAAGLGEESQALWTFPFLCGQKLQSVIWHTVRMSALVCPEASPKIWGFVGWKNSIAFQPCITLKVFNWSKWVNKIIFSKNCLQNRFLLRGGPGSTDFRGGWDPKY